MTKLRARTPIAAWTLAALSAAGCRASAPPLPGPGAAPAADETRIQRAVDDRLRALFPEVAGELTRASIAHALVVGAAADPESADVPTAAIAAIRAGDFPLARGLLGELVARKEVQKAREFLAAGDERSAIAVLDRAVDTAPDSAALRILRADAEFAVAQESHEQDFAQRALEDFQDAARKRGGARALLGASRAARSLGRADDALGFARAGLDALDGEDLDLPGALSPERVWAEASLDVLRQGALDGASGALARESETALHSSIARSPEDPWAWRALARLQLARKAPADARRTALRALQSFPSDDELHALLFDALVAVGGHDAVVAEYERFAAAHPDVAIAHWNLARGCFETALDALQAKKVEALPLFARAEPLFARAASLYGSSVAGMSAQCARQVALCRTGAGYARLSAGDLEAARDAFLSVEDADEGALAADLGPRLANGVQGLAAVGRAFAAAADRPGAGTIDALERALRVFEYLREYDRANPAFAAQAATLDRNAAIAIELEARALASQRKIEEANLRLARARELMEQSLSAATAAVALAPGDARMARDAGCVLTNYLQRDADTAEAWLTKAVTLSRSRALELTARRDAPGVEAAERRALARELEEIESASSDACECLGVLFLTLKGDALAARAWFEKSIAQSPEPRESVQGKGGWLDRCDAAIESKQNPRVRDDERWAAPIEKPDAEH